MARLLGTGNLLLFDHSARAREGFGQRKQFSVLIAGHCHLHTLGRCARPGVPAATSSATSSLIARPVPSYCSASDKGQQSKPPTLYLTMLPPLYQVLTKTKLLLAGILCQDDEESKSHEAKLCEDKSSGELFRLKGGEDSCRDVIQCTAAVSGSFEHP